MSDRPEVQPVADAPPPREEGDAATGEQGTPAMAGHHQDEPGPETTTPAADAAADSDDSRRSFIKKVGIGAVAGGIAAAVAGPAFRYLAGTAIESDTDQEWVPLGVASSVPIGEPTLLKSSVERKAGWLVTRRELSVYVVTADGQDFTAFSNICSHLGCRVRWVTEQGSFFCPCHNAVFAADGSVVTGPPPRPLDRFEVRVEEGQIEVRDVT